MKFNPLSTGQRFRRRKLQLICEEARKEIHKYTDFPQLTGVRLILLEQQMTRLLNETCRKIEDLIYMGAETMVNDTLAHLSRTYYNNTSTRVPNSVIGRIRSESMRRFVSMPNNNNTFFARTRTWERRTRVGIKSRLEQALGEQLGRRRLTNLLGECFYSPFVVRGGSLFDSMERLLISEENQLYHNIMVRFSNDVGITFIRFSVLPDRPVRDECDDIAEYEDFFIKQRFENIGLSAKGVYTLSTLPPYPHPRALYILEPIYETGFIRLFGG